LGFPTGRSFTRHQAIFSGAIAREEEDFCKGSFHMHIHYFVLSFAFTLFLLASFYQKYKKLVPFIVVIFVGLLLS
jgi:hypothetical protein